MKNIVRVLALTLALIMVVGTLVSCGGTTLSGTYTDSTGLASYTFKGNKVTMSVLGLSIEGEYEIKGDKITINISEESVKSLEDFGLSAEDLSETVDFAKDGDTITIDGETYTKKD